MTIKNKIGLEAEFILANDKRELIFPDDFGYGTDEYVLLAEIRADPGETPEETVANFIKTFTFFSNSLNKNGLGWNSSGHYMITPEFNSKVLRRMGNKEISQSQNIYGTDLLTLTDDVIEEGKIIGRNISAGLHVHFSSEEKIEVRATVENDYQYSPISIPLQFGDGVPLKLDLYRRAELSEINKKKPIIARASANRITIPVIKHIVKEMDVLLDEFLWGDDETKKLKYRQPGFYEKKSHGGFEYRSLPANERTLSLHTITKIVNYSFKLLEEL